MIKWLKNKFNPPEKNHCFHRMKKGNLVCCWCGDPITYEEQTENGHGGYRPTEYRTVSRVGQYCYWASRQKTYSDSVPFMY